MAPDLPVIDVADGLSPELLRAPVLGLFGESGVGRSRLAASVADRVVTVETWNYALLERLRLGRPLIDPELLAAEVLVSVVRSPPDGVR